MAPRPYGQGSVYQRQSDGRWMASLELPGSPTRKRKVFTSKTREGVEAALDAWLAEHPRPRFDGARARPGHRSDHMDRARALGTHTAEQWREKVEAANGLCHYCRRPWLWILHKDHMTPVSRGGSDGIDNIVPTCADCNLSKSDMTVAEFLAFAAEVDLFNQPRWAQVGRGARIVRMPQERAWRLRTAAKKAGRPWHAVGMEPR